MLTHSPATLETGFTSWAKDFKIREDVSKADNFPDKVFFTFESESRFLDPVWLNFLVYCMVKGRMELSTNMPECVSKKSVNEVNKTSQTSHFLNHKLSLQL